MVVGTVIAITRWGTNGFGSLAPGDTTIRVVPRVEREEFINVGVVLFSRPRKFLGVQARLDGDRLRALWPELDLDAATGRGSNRDVVAELMRDAAAELADGAAGAGAVLEAGSERVVFRNLGTKPVEVLPFHLYPNAWSGTVTR